MPTCTFFFFASDFQWCYSVYHGSPVDIQHVLSVETTFLFIMPFITIDEDKTTLEMGALSAYDYVFFLPFPDCQYYFSHLDFYGGSTTVGHLTPLSDGAQTTMKCFFKLLKIEDALSKDGFAFTKT